MPAAVRRQTEQEPQNLIFKAKVTAVKPEQIKIIYTTHQCEDVDINYTFSHDEHKLNIKSLLPDIGVDIDFLVDGSVVINEGNPNYDINIKTSANITTTKDINCNRLTLSGGGIFLKHNVTTVRKCTLEYEQQLENHGKLTVVRSSLEFLGAKGSRLSNFGTIDTRGLVTFNKENRHHWSRVINYGLIVAKEDIFIRVLSFYNFNSLLSTTKITTVAKQIFNCGIMFAQQYIGFSSYNVINDNNAIIASNHDVSISGVDGCLKKEEGSKDNKLLTNKGTIKALDKLYLANNNIENQLAGVLLGERIVVIAGQLINDGLMNGSKKIEVSLLSDIDGCWYNTKTGTVQTLDLSCRIQQLFNEGKIEAQQNFTTMLKDLQNKLGGQILSDANMSLLVLRAVINDSLIQATEELFINSESIEIGKEGKVVANKISINSQNVVTEGVVSAGELAQIMSRFFDARIGSKTVAADELKMYIVEQLNNSGSIAASAVTLTASQVENSGNISGLHSAKITAFDSFKQNARADIISNLGRINLLAGNALISGEIEAKLANILQANNQILINQDGTIKSDGTTTLSSHDVSNNGTVTAGAGLTVNAYHELENAATGTIQAPEVAVNAFKLTNAGKFLASNKLSVKTSILNNLYAALIESASKLELETTQLQNAGSIAAYTELQLTILNCLENLQSGKIGSLGQLILDTKITIENLGIIAAQELEILGGCNIDNLGAIAATSGTLTITDARTLMNSGDLSSVKNIELASIGILQNLQTGTISAVAGLKVIADLLIKNQGQLIAYDMCLNAAGSLLLNGNQYSHQLTASASSITNDGTTTAEIIDFAADLIAIDGQLNASSLKLEARNYLHLLKNGEINCAHAAQLLSKAGFVNLGKILSGGRLTIIANELFHAETASIDASGELFLQAIDMYLNGDIKASQDLLVMAENKFTYKTANLKANGELVLTLYDGTKISQDIKTPGNLKLEFLTKDGIWYNQQQLQAAGDLSINVPGYILVNSRFTYDALIQAGNTLKMRADQIHVTHGALAGKQLDLKAREHIVIDANGHIIGDSGTLQADLGVVEQQGRVEFLHNLTVMAKKAHLQYTSSTAVGNNLRFTVDKLMLDGWAHVGGEFSAKVMEFHLSQYASTLQVPVIYNATVGQVVVSIQQADPNTGVLSASKITIDCDKFTQLGGQIKSGDGGTYIEVTGEAFLEGLRTSHIWQGQISMHGRNYAIVPVFVPAKIESDGDLFFNVKQGKFVGASIELKAVGVKEVKARDGVEITKKYEHYDHPQYIQPEEDDDLCGTIFSVAACAIASCCVGPAACGLMGITAASTSTLAVSMISAAIGGATSAALNGGKFNDIFKSAALSAFTAGFMDKFKFAAEGAAQAANAAKATVTTATRLSAAANNVLKNVVNVTGKSIIDGKAKLDPVSMLGAGVAGFTGASLDGFGRDITAGAINTTIRTMAHGGKILPNLTISTAEAACSHLGDQLGNQIGESFAKVREEAKAKAAKDPQQQDGNIAKATESQSANKGKERVNPHDANQQRPIKSQTEFDVALAASVDQWDQDLNRQLARMQEEQRIIDKHGLEIHQYRKGTWLDKAAGVPLYYLASLTSGTAYADELEQPNKDEASSSTSRFSDVVDTVAHDFAEARHTVDDTRDFNLDNAQPTWVLNKFQPLYSRWKDSRRVYLEEMSSLYGNNAFDPDIYVQQAQSKWMLDHLTVGERRYNFNPGNPVLYNSASAAVFSERIYSTLAYDLFRFGNQDLGIGPTSFIVAKGTFSPLEIKNSKLNSNAKINLHIGTNVFQVNSHYLNANINIYTCAVEGKVRDFLPDETPNLSVSVNQSCSTAEVLLTLKKEPICLGNTCLQGEGNVSLRFGTVGEKTKFDSPSNPDYSVTSNLRIEITKKPKPSQG